jgi:type IV pilus assembly protein PilA
MRTNPRRCCRNGRGFTLIELLLVVAVIAIVSAIALPAMMRARISANEASAVASIRTVIAAEQAYAAGAGGGYATALATLGTTCPNSSVPFISADLVEDPSTKGGYRVSLHPSAGAAAGPADCNGKPTSTGFFVIATPLSLGFDGHRGFAANAGGAIFFDPTGAAPLEAKMLAGEYEVVR